MVRKVAPYGEWVSPIGAADTISTAVNFSEVTYHDGEVYWIEGRPSDKGRQVIVTRSPDGTISDLTPATVNARTRVHEYGGGSMLVTSGGVYYPDFADQRLYRLARGLEPSPITPAATPPLSETRFADGRQMPDGRIVYVRESHDAEGDPSNEVVIIDPSDGEQFVVASGADFYSDPRPSSDGSKIAWVEWDHPNMPWDETRLRVASLDGSTMSVAGGAEQSVNQPVWTPDGDLLYLSDETGWWNLYQWDGNESRPVLTMEADFGLPQWVFGRPTYVVLDDGRIISIFFENGIQRLGLITSGSLEPIDLGFTSHTYLTTDGTRRVWFVGHRADGSVSLAEHDLQTGRTTEVKGNKVRFDPGYLSVPRPITFPTTEGVAHAIFYPPTNRDFEAPAGTLPPVMVRVHGGPTSAVFPYLDPRYAYWTSRGVGIVDVNYRGSTGFGRGYRNKLRGMWGIADVEDAVAAARYLVDTGEADPDRLLISGGSAGGFTVLAALSSADAFAAGASYYGVADLNLLNEHTHKFESRYLDRLISSDPEVLTERSPITHVDRIKVPVILFQGLKDRVVPPEQSELIAAALERNGIVHEYITYENEDHGFRDAANIVHALQSELAFYGRVLGFDPHV